MPKTGFFLKIKERKKGKKKFECGLCFGLFSTRKKIFFEKLI